MENKFEQYQRELEAAYKLADQYQEAAQEIEVHDHTNLMEVVFGNRVYVYYDNKNYIESRLARIFFNEILNQSRYNNFSGTNYDLYIHENGNKNTKTNSFTPENVEAFEAAMMTSNQKELKKFVTWKLRDGKLTSNKLKIRLYASLYNDWNESFKGYNDAMHDLLVFIKICYGGDFDIKKHSQTISDAYGQSGQITFDFGIVELKIYKNSSVDIVINDPNMLNRIKSMMV